jgi:holin-like protein
MLAGLTILLLFQCAGEVIVHALGLPFPGPVLGMLLLFLTLALRGGGVPKDLADAAHGILRHLSLLFLPAGVGVMLYWRTLSNSLAPIVVVLLVSTIVTIAVTALVVRALSRGDGATAAPAPNAPDAASAADPE